MSTVARALAIALALSAGCSDTTGIRSSDVFVRTERAEYSLVEARDAGLPVVLENRGMQAVSITGCPSPPSFIVERLTDAGAVDETQWGLVCLGIYSPKTETVAAGASREFRVVLYRTGRYRLRVLLGEEWGDREHSAYSNTFDVR